MHNHYMRISLTNLLLVIDVDNVTSTLTHYVSHVDFKHSMIRLKINQQDYTNNKFPCRRIFSVRQLKKPHIIIISPSYTDTLKYYKQVYVVNHPSKVEYFKDTIVYINTFSIL